MYSVLVVDDENELRKQIVSLLSERGYEVEQCENGAEALERLRARNFSLVLCDVKMPEMDGLAFLRAVKGNEIPTTVALITAHGNVRDAVAAIKDGAFDYIEKPINEPQLVSLVEKAERAFEMIHRIAYSAPMSPGEGRECVGTSQGMTRVFQLVERLTRVNTSVLIRGENGTGKELVARAIHFNSPRKDAPFVAINCGAIPEALIESELFGHEKGAFTGADSRKIGRFQYAAGGTLFLDEIGDTSLPTQVKLLRVLQEHTFTPVGSPREVKADVRIIAATNQNLEKRIQEGKFREDLFYRLNVMPLFLPPLRERKDDIPALTHHFIEKFNQDHGKTFRTMTADGLAMLEAYHWPGNIRELENAIEHAFVVETSNEITHFSLPEYIRRPSRKAIAPPKRPDKDISVTSSDWETGKETFERAFIIQALRTYRGRINQTAERANIPKNTLLRKIKKYSITPQEYGGSESDLSGI